jgi:hypothetical protein
MRRFSPTEVARIRDLVARGYSCIGIADELKRDALAVRHKVSALGLRTRPRKRKNVQRVVIGADVLALLRGEAELRGVTAQRLASQILCAVAVDKIVDAVVDDDGARQRKLERQRRIDVANEGMVSKPSSLPRDLNIIMSRQPIHLRASVQVPQFLASLNCRPSAAQQCGYKTPAMCG